MKNRFRTMNVSGMLHSMKDFTQLEEEFEGWVIVDREKKEISGRLYFDYKEALRAVVRNEEMPRSEWIGGGGK